MQREFLTGFVIIIKGNTAQLTAIKERNTINIPSIHGDKAIKEIANSGNEINNISIVNTDSIRSVKIKSAKSKNLV